MTTKSHYDFALYLLRNCTYFDSDSANTSFLLGCVEPDMNIATELKGSLSCQPLRGHNYPNSTPCVKTLLKKLQYGQKNDFLYYYRIGKLIHYLTDAFTYPHNSSFEGSIHEHRVYEQELEKHFNMAMHIRFAKHKIYDANQLYSYFSAAHDEYIKKRPGTETDTHFILSVIPSAFASLYPAVPVTYRKKGGRNI